MRSHIFRTTFACVLLGLGAGLCLAGTAEQQPFLGVQLEPVPELLAKHLGLDPEEGVRIANVAVDSPADRAGLERDDIVVGFQGRKVEGPNQFVASVRQANIGEKISLEVIHLGRRREHEVVLAPLGEASDWKYPAEPKPVLSWRPGRLYKIGPEGREWVEVPFDRLPEMEVDMNRFFKEIHTYHHMTDGQDFAITVEGDPEDPKSRVIVQVGDTEHVATVGTLDALPEKYRGPAKKALRDARSGSRSRSSIRGRLRLPEPPTPDVYRKFFQTIPRPDLGRLSEQKDQAVEKLQGQMERLQQQMKDLEERNRKMLERLLEKMGDRLETQETEKPAVAEPEEDQPI